MGWTSYLIHGKLNRKEECDRLFELNPNMQLVKSVMVGSTYYGAIRILKKFDEEINDYVNIPLQDQKVFAMIILTNSSTNKSGTYFSYKEMSENLDPCCYQCPISILNLLTPTENEWACKWRENCKMYHRKKTELKNASYGTRIELSINDDVMVFRKTKDGKYTRWFNNERKYLPESRIANYDYSFVN